jgi:hypothetical protein
MCSIIEVPIERFAWGGTEAAPRNDIGLNDLSGTSHLPLPYPTSQNRAGCHEEQGCGL